MQDNKSCILLHKNWPFSTRKGSKHINVHYFFVVMKIKNKEVRVIFCPTEQMVADYQSKPLQGILFVDHRNKIMGVQPEDFNWYKRMYIKVHKHYELYMLTRTICSTFRIHKSVLGIYYFPATKWLTVVHTSTCNHTYKVCTLCVTV